MGFRLKTSKKTKEIFEYIGASSNLKPFALCKIAISLSLRDIDSIENFEDTDIHGLELQRATVTGEYDTIYKALMEIKLQRHLSDDEYYPIYTKKHIDKGAQLLSKLYEYSGGNLEKFLTHITIKGGMSL
ncbi:DndE family protein [Maledivibacter halophilus]|uniref:DNA sulfur modification protein DndE n=1 Tax=Maledivibacter halophilus TaxID=36842 RepID=A0A1T5LNI9_9FIRM|nr:DndE family protein [Maledivibacter halophilus]SKC77532.1 DNA sulfur modification protein DndE [Maledivibacter halophilus]